MKRARLTLVLILSIVLLCGCVEAPPPDIHCTAAPTETTAPPPETTLPPETTAPAADFSEYYALLDASAEPNWLARSLGCLYEKPSEVDLTYMFYLGVNHPGSWDDLGQGSRKALVLHGFMKEMDLQLMPAEKLEAALQATFGIGIEDVTIPDHWCYIKEENLYCSNNNDAFFPGIPVITAVEDDGTYITIRYTIEDYWVTATDEMIDSARLVLSLVRNDDGTIHAVSNLLES